MLHYVGSNISMYQYFVLHNTVFLQISCNYYIVFYTTPQWKAISDTMSMKYLCHVLHDAMNHGVVNWFLVSCFTRFTMSYVLISSSRCESPSKLVVWWSASVTGSAHWLRLCSVTVQDMPNLGGPALPRLELNFCISRPPSQYCMWMCLHDVV